ncbi:MAG: hypothetical protein IPL06_17535 [Betaproteobacteria bacterium]|nr:hypothetical protein [Betaproteobacteria bacterium]
MGGGTPVATSVWAYACSAETLGAGPLVNAAADGLGVTLAVGADDGPDPRALRAVTVHV